MDFDVDFLKQFSNSNTYPVELKKVCDWLELSDEHTALNLVQSYFEELVDYTTSKDNDCYLTVNCLRELMLIANTPKGKAARRYYLEFDRIGRPLGDRPQYAAHPETHPETVSIIAPTEKPLPVMRTREMQRLEMEALPALAKKIPKFRRAVDIARERAAKAAEEVTIDW